MMESNSRLWFLLRGLRLHIYTVVAWMVSFLLQGTIPITYRIVDLDQLAYYRTVTIS